MKRVDSNTRGRKKHSVFFRRSDYAQYHIGTNIGIAAFKQAAKAQGIPFSFAMAYMLTAATNKVEAFR